MYVRISYIAADTKIPMARRRNAHRQHERTAVFAFIFVLLIAVGAFYYIWQTQATYGRSAEGQGEKNDETVGCIPTDRHSKDLPATYNSVV